MSKADAWMPLYIGDYLSDTMHLEAQEHGAYLLLLMHYWRTGPLPDDDRFLAGIARVDRKTWAADTGPIVREFFELGEDGRLHQKRIDEERARTQKLSSTRRDAANAKHAKHATAPAPQVQPASKTDANEGADAGANAEHLDTHACARQSQSQSERKEAAAGASADEPAPGHQPLRDDASEKWLGLSSKREVDGKGRTHAVVGGMYLDQAADLVCEAAKIRSSSWRGDWRPLIAWLEEGVDFHAVILPAVKRLAARAGYSPPRSLAYFDSAVRELGHK